MSAKEFANFIASERHEKITTTVGYQDKLESQMGPTTILTVCQNEILLRTLMGNNIFLRHETTIRLFKNSFLGKLGETLDQRWLWDLMLQKINLTLSIEKTRSSRPNSIYWQFIQVSTILFYTVDKRLFEKVIVSHRRKCG